MVFGDSLSAGYGLPRGVGWVDLLAQRLQREYPDYKVVNASISGETTVGGRNRIADALTQHRPAIVIIELGANDGLRGAAPDTIRLNLSIITGTARKRGARVLLIGMQLPPNYGMDYTEKFKRAFATVAAQQQAAFVPFLFEGFAADPAQFQADGLHPAVGAQSKMLDTVWKQLQPLLSKRAAGGNQ